MEKVESVFERIHQQLRFFLSSGSLITRKGSRVDSKMMEKRLSASVAGGYIEKVSDMQHLIDFETPHSHFDGYAKHNRRCSTKPTNQQMMDE